jgi:hypothetical protein
MIPNKVNHAVMVFIRGVCPGKGGLQRNINQCHCLHDIAAQQINLRLGGT